MKAFRFNVVSERWQLSLPVPRAKLLEQKRLWKIVRPLSQVVVIVETNDAVTDTGTETNKETSMPAKAAVETGNPVVVMETTCGTITAELWPDKAPVVVSNFVAYVKSGFYDGLVFHRVISGFMIQGFWPRSHLQQKNTNPPIRNEAKSEAKNGRGTLSMARTSDINSATSQFFINLVDNGALDHRSENPAGFGYCVFGKVIEGMDVVDKIGQVKTTVMNGMGDVPVQPVVIKSAKTRE